MNDIKDFELELKVLQKKDTETALSMGIKTKKDWFEYIMKQEKDEIAEAIMDLSTRYNIPLSTVAYNFDPTMVMRVGKIVEKGNNQEIKKQ